MNCPTGPTAPSKQPTNTVIDTLESSHDMIDGIRWFHVATSSTFCVMLVDLHLGATNCKLMMDTTTDMPVFPQRLLIEDRGSTQMARVPTLGVLVTMELLYTLKPL